MCANERLEVDMSSFMENCSHSFIDKNNIISKNLV